MDAIMTENRLLVLETELRHCQASSVALGVISDSVTKTSVLVAEALARERRVLEYLDRLEARATKSEMDIRVSATHLAYLEKAIYVAAGIFTASFSGIVVFVMNQVI